MMNVHIDEFNLLKLEDNIKTWISDYLVTRMEEATSKLREMIQTECELGADSDPLSLTVGQYFVAVGYHYLILKLFCIDANRLVSAAPVACLMTTTILSEMRCLAVHVGSFLPLHAGARGLSSLDLGCWLLW
jgi:hypothetical protein